MIDEGGGREAGLCKVVSRWDTGSVWELERRASRKREDGGMMPGDVVGGLHCCFVGLGQWVGWGIFDFRLFIVRLTIRFTHSHPVPASPLLVCSLTLDELGSSLHQRYL